MYVDINAKCNGDILIVAKAEYTATKVSLYRCLHYVVEGNQNQMFIRREDYESLMEQLTERQFLKDTKKCLGSRL
jgi:hypothetical protein